MEEGVLQCNFQIISKPESQSVNCLVVSDSSCYVMVRPWNSLGKNTGVGRHALLQGIFLTQGWN